MANFSSERIDDVEHLERRLGPPSKFARMLDIDHIDAHIRLLLDHARLCLMVVRPAGRRPRVLTTASETPVCEILSLKCVRFSRPDGLASAERLRAGDGLGSLLIIPGLGETVRLNGRVLEDEGEGLVVVIDEAIVHCAKAFLRSAFWTRAGQRAPTLAPSLDDPRDFIRSAPLVCIGSMPSTGAGDVSPKGEGGPVAVFDGEDCLIIAERPGNQRHDTFRNIVDQPEVALLFLLPGQDRAVHVQGKMRVMIDKALQAAMTSGGRPARAICTVEIESLEAVGSLGLARSRFWEPSTWPAAASLPSIGQIMHDHIKLHRDHGAAAERVRAALDLDELEASARADYRDNL